MTKKPPTYYAQSANNYSNPSRLRKVLKVAEEEAKPEIEIVREYDLTIRPAPDIEYHQIYVTYRTPEVIVGTVIIRADEIAPENVALFLEQFKAKEGALYEKYLEVLKEKIKADIERRKAPAPRKIRL